MQTEVEQLADKERQLNEREAALNVMVATEEYYNLNVF